MSYNIDFSRTSPNSTPGSASPRFFGRARTIEAIAIHWWGDPNQNPSYEGIVSFLCNPNAGVSAHFVATGTGRRVAQIVNFGDVSWATNSANPWTISIECDPRCRDEDYDVVAELIAQIRSAYGDLPLVPHRQFVATACPGNYDLGRLDRIARTKDGSGDWGDVKSAQQNANHDQIRSLYREILERDADQGALNHYQNYTVDFVRADLLKSDEYRNLQARKAAEAAARTSFVLKSTSPVFGKKFKATRPTVLVNIPDNTKASVAGQLDYAAGHNLEFAELLQYENGAGEKRAFYRTGFWSGRGKLIGFNANDIEEVQVVTTPPADIPVVTPTPEPQPQPEVPSEPIESPQEPSQPESGTPTHSASTTLWEDVLRLFQKIVQFLSKYKRN